METRVVKTPTRIDNVIKQKQTIIFIAAIYVTLTVFGSRNFHDYLKCNDLKRTQAKMQTAIWSSQHRQLKKLIFEAVNNVRFFDGFS